jgi:hypothetical protein
VTTAARSTVLPDVVTVGDVVPGYEASFWTGVGAPKNIPAEIVGQLNREINATFTDINMRVAAGAGDGGAVVPSIGGRRGNRFRVAGDVRGRNSADFTAGRTNYNLGPTSPGRRGVVLREEALTHAFTPRVPALRCR